MTTNGDDNLGDLLSQMGDDDHADAAVAAKSAAPRPVHKPGAVRPPEAGKLKIISTILAYVVGLALMGFAGYGAMIMRGAIEVEKENAEDMAKLMLFAAGPIGAILLIAALALTAQMLFHRR